MLFGGEGAAEGVRMEPLRPDVGLTRLDMTRVGWHTAATGALRSHSIDRCRYRYIYMPHPCCPNVSNE